MRVLLLAADWEPAQAGQHFRCTAGFTSSEAWRPVGNWLLWLVPALQEESCCCRDSRESGKLAGRQLACCG